MTERKTRPLPRPNPQKTPEAATPEAATTEIPAVDLSKGRHTPPGIRGTDVKAPPAPEKPKEEPVKPDPNARHGVAATDKAEPIEGKPMIGDTPVLTRDDLPDQAERAAKAEKTKAAKDKAEKEAFAKFHASLNTPWKRVKAGIAGAAHQVRMNGKAWTVTTADFLAVFINYGTGIITTAAISALTLGTTAYIILGNVKTGYDIAKVGLALATILAIAIYRLMDGKTK